jgi:hypothetical protein
MGLARKERLKREAVRSMVLPLDDLRRRWASKHDPVALRGRIRAARAAREERARQ